MKKIAVLDDDESFRDFLKSLFELRGHRVRCFSTPGEFLDGAGEFGPDLILLDVQLPHVDGWQFLRTLRALDPFRKAPIVLVTGAHRRALDVVAGFEAGADEYLTKPVVGEVLAARVEALMRRYGWKNEPEREEEVRLGPLLLSPARREASLDGKSVKLSRLEFDLMLYLLEHPDKVHSREELRERVWPQGAAGGRNVDKYVEYLRRKLSPFGRKIETVVGVGYILRSR